MRPASLTTLAKRIPQRQWLRLSLVEKSDHRHHRLLRARRERPRGCRAAEERDKRAAVHSITSSARADTRDFARRDLWNSTRLPSHSGLTFAALMIGAQRAISLFTSTASDGWPRRALSGTSQPISASRLRTFSSSRALSSASVSRSRIG